MDEKKVIAKKFEDIQTQSPGRRGGKGNSSGRDKEKRKAKKTVEKKKSPCPSS